MATSPTTSTASRCCTPRSGRLTGRYALVFGIAAAGTGNGFSPSRFLLCQILHYPNHLLYSTPLANHKVSQNATFELALEFGMETTNQTIQEFVSAVKVRRLSQMTTATTGCLLVSLLLLLCCSCYAQAYVLQAKKDDWADVMFFCSGVNPVTNSVLYSIWVTSKGGWQEVPRIFGARTELNLFLRQYLTNRGIKYSFPTQPVSFESEEGGSYGEHSHRAALHALKGSPRM